MLGTVTTDKRQGIARHVPLANMVLEPALNAWIVRLEVLVLLQVSRAHALLDTLATAGKHA